MTHYDLSGPDGTFAADVTPTHDGFHVRIGESDYFVRLKRGADGASLIVEVSDKPAEVTIVEASGQRVELVLDGERLSFQRRTPSLVAPRATQRSTSAKKGEVAAPLPGKVIGALVKKGDRVRAGDPLVILESMKMEIAVRSDADSTVEDILVGEGESVKRGQVLVRLG